MVNSQWSELASDRFGTAHLVWKPTDEDIYYYSRWDGKVWTMPIDIIAATDHVGLGPPALVAADDGQLHLFWAHDHIWHSWAWSGDAARSARAWSVPEVIVVPQQPPPAPMDAEQAHFGAFHVVYSAGGGIYHMHSDGEGLTWTNSTLVSWGRDTTMEAEPRLDVEPDGSIHVVWTEWPLGGDPSESAEVYYTHSTDGGEDWSEPRQLGELDSRGGNVLATAAGTVYVAWQAGVGSPSTGRFIQWSTDGGSTWESPVNFGQAQGQTGYPGLALDSEGTLHIITGEAQYTNWDGQLVYPPLDLRPLPEQTENSRLTIVNGNQLLVVSSPFWSPGLYYTVRQLPVPALPTATLPTRAPILATPAPAPAIEKAASTKAPMATAAVMHSSTLSIEEPGSFTVPALALGLGLSMALVAVVVIVQLGRRRR
jgi:hypothetical protein